MIHNIYLILYLHSQCTKRFEALITCFLLIFSCAFIRCYSDWFLEFSSVFQGPVSLARIINKNSIIWIITKIHLTPWIHFSLNEVKIIPEICWHYFMWPLPHFCNINKRQVCDENKLLVSQQNCQHTSGLLFHAYIFHGKNETEKTAISQMHLHVYVIYF